jgi:hypothetical protein
MHLVYYHLHFLCHGSQGPVKPSQTFGLYPILLVFLQGAAN